LKLKIGSLGEEHHESKIQMIVVLALLNPGESDLDIRKYCSEKKIFIVQIKFDVERFSDMAKVSTDFNWETSTSDESLKKYFEDTSVGHLEDPAILVDKFGRILLWYLPGILSHCLV
jgi:hypothetical protein